MGDPSRGVIIDKNVNLLDSLLHVPSHHGGGTRDLFHAVHCGGAGVGVSTSMSPPVVPAPRAGPSVVPPPRAGSSVVPPAHSHPASHSHPHSRGHSHLESFSGASEPGSLMDLLVRPPPPHHQQGVRSSGHQPDMLVSLGEDVLGPSDGSQEGNLQFFDPPPPLKKGSWGGTPAAAAALGQSKQQQLPSTSLWVLPRPPLNKSGLPLPGLAAGNAGSTDAAQISSEDRMCQNSRPQASVWRGRGEESAQAGMEKSIQTLRKQEKSLGSEAAIAGGMGAAGGAGCRTAGDSVSLAIPMKDFVGEADTKFMESSDCSDHNMDEQEDRDAHNAQMGTERNQPSKNLVSERKRRKKLNEGLYTLRSLVPRISKMDKASIIGDAIDYVRELQKQVEDLQTGISNMEANAVGGEEVLSTTAAAEQSGAAGPVCESLSWEDGKNSSGEKPAEDNVVELMTEAVEQQILELDVSLMEDQIYHLQIFCTKGPGVFVQLMQSLEALGLEVLNANLTSLQDNIVNTFIAEIKDWEMTKTEDVKKAIMDVASRFGLQ